MAGNKPLQCGSPLPRANAIGRRSGASSGLRAEDSGRVDAPGFAALTFGAGAMVCLKIKTRGIK